MNKEMEQRYWQAAHKRLQALDWNLPFFEKEVDESYAKLSPRKENENEIEWLLRVLPVARPYKFSPFTEIIRRVADSSLEEYPLPDDGFLFTEDESLQITINQQNNNVLIKVESLGEYVDKLANCNLGIAYKKNPKTMIAIIKLNDMGDGDVVVEDCIEVRRALSSPLIGLVE